MSRWLRIILLFFLFFSENVPVIENDFSNLFWNYVPSWQLLSNFTYNFGTSFPGYLAARTGVKSSSSSESVLPGVGFVGYSSTIWIEGMSNMIFIALLLYATLIYFFYYRAHIMSWRFLYTWFIKNKRPYLSLNDKNEKFSHA